MGSEWKTERLIDSPVEIIDGDRGKNYPSLREFSPFGYCLFLNASNVTNNGFNFLSCNFVSKEKDEQLRKGKLKRNDIVFTTRGTVGNIAFYDNSIPYEHVRINSGMVIFRVDQKKVFPRFFYYYLNSKLFSDQVSGLQTGSAQPQLPIRDINLILFSYPHLEEQKRIAHILGTLDDKIELNQRMNETLEAMAKALFKAWFVDFEPVKAKMRGEPYPLPGEIMDLFPDELVESELGLIPKGWRVGVLGDIITNQSERVKNEKVQVLSAIASSELVKSDQFFTKRVYSKELSNYKIVNQWDFAFNPARINIGSIGLHKGTFIGAVSPVYVVFHTEYEYVWYIKFFLKTDYTKNWIKTLASGSVRQSVTFDSICIIPCIIPQINITLIFNKLWTILNSEIDHNNNEGITLCGLKEYLLLNLMKK